MPLAAGDKLGPYQIVSLIGKGGMGEVYRAHDPRVGRDVAIKVSSAQFSERFEREARAVAALNHPNICTLYDVGPNYLVMEYVEGTAPRGPMDLKDALDLARQIASALEEAHGKGVTHRDLKPANIKVRPDGTVKVLDFGLAKMSARPGAAPAEDSPTMSMGGTESGVILGTAPYMSPEQARGLTVDKRTDIWAFGVVLYELLTGKRPFRGATMTDTLSAVVSQEPDWSRIPAHARRAVKSCLQKDLKHRLHDIADVMLLMGEPDVMGESGRDVRRRDRRPYWYWAAATGALVAIALWAPWRTSSPARETTRFQIPLPDDAHFTSARAFTVSPDGRKVAFAATGADGVARLWLRMLDSLEIRPLAGTEGSIDPPPPFWSPDSRFLVFHTGGRLRKLDVVAGGPAQIIAEVATVFGGAWNSEGVIIFGGGSGGLMKIPAEGGNPVPLTVSDPILDIHHELPCFLADGRSFLYFRHARDPRNSGTYLGTLDVKPEEQSQDRLIASEFQAGCVPSASPGGNVLFMREDTLLVQTLDLEHRKLTGEPKPIAASIASPVRGYALFSASTNGVLAYRTGLQRSFQLTWNDRNGKATGTIGKPDDYRSVALAPDGRRAAVTLRDRLTGNQDIWLIDLPGGSSSRFTFDPAEENQPVWSPEGKWIAFHSNRGGGDGIYRKAASGEGNEEALAKPDNFTGLTGWTPDGRFLIYVVAAPQTREDIWLLPMTGARNPIAFTQTKFREALGQVSPDGRWISYLSDQSGDAELYVHPLHLTEAGIPAASKDLSSGQWMVSRGVLVPIGWALKSKELYYLAPDGSIMAVEVTTEPAFRAKPPTRLFKLPATAMPPLGSPNRLVDASSDGQRFLILSPVEEHAREELTVTLNWEAGLKK